jgi:hypothetical protein
MDAQPFHLIGNPNTYSDNKDYFRKLSHYTTLDAKFLYRHGRPWSLAYQVGKPIKEFWQMYIVEKGFLDGWAGLKLCLFSAYYRWNVAKKLKKLEKSANRKESLPFSNRLVPKKPNPSRKILP